MAALTPEQYLAIMGRVNSIILYAQLGNDAKVDEGYQRLTDFVSGLAERPARRTARYVDVSTYADAEPVLERVPPTPA